MNPTRASRSALSVVLACLLFGGMLSGTAGAQQAFRLIVADNPVLSSAASISERELTITDAQGQTFRYQRDPRLDSADGQYLGFYSPQMQQAVRWPVAGQGRMVLGDAQGLNWRESLQQVQAAPPIPGAIIRPGGGLGGPSPPGPTITPAMPPGQGLGAGPGIRPGAKLLAHGTPGSFSGSAAHLAFGADRRGSQRLGVIDNTGLVRIYEPVEGQWRYRLEISGLDLIPGAPLALAPDITPGLPRVYTTNRQGSLVMLSREQGPMPVAPQIAFPPGADVSVAVVDRNQFGFAVDAAGRLWQLDLLRQAHQPVETTPGVLMPGSHVSVLHRPGTNRPPLLDLYVTDLRGQLTRYQQIVGGWSPREVVAEGFLPGAPVGATYLEIPNRGSLLFLSAVDGQGQLQLLSGPSIGMQMATLDAGSLPPGAHVLLQTALDGVHVSAVGIDGGWRVWTPGPAGVWNNTVIANGFPPGAPVVTDPVTGGLAAVDVRGRIVPAVAQDGHWQCLLCHHDIVQPPRLVSRRIIPQPPLPPATVTLVNSGTDELVVQIADALDPMQSREVSLAPRTSSVQAFERDAGAMVEEIYLLPGPGRDWVQQVERYPLPPQPRYSLAVWANRVTYQYIDDRKNRPAGARPSFDLKSHVSIGVFDLPPGDLLQDGETIDLFAEASRLSNAGAAGYFGPPGGIPKGMSPR